MRLPHVLFVMQHVVRPGQVQEGQDLLHPLLGVQHQLLVVDPEAAAGAHLVALVVHGRDGGVPLGQALPVRLEVESGYGHLARDDGVDGGATVADHEEELGVGEEPLEVRARLEREGVLVAEARGGLPVARHHLQDEGGERRVEDVPRQPGLLQAHRFFLQTRRTENSYKNNMHF